jgi:hypothetical protein
MADELKPRDESLNQTVIWQPGPKQASFISCPADDVGYGGSRGGGKSDAVIGDWLGHEYEFGEAAIGMAFRRTTVQINELIERSKQILTPLGHKWHEQGHFFRGPKGGRLRFTYLERDADADNYQGHSYTRLYPEEIGTFPNEQPINKLFATLRSGHGVPCQMKSTCNPGGPGHNWVKARYRLSGILTKPSYYEFDLINPFTKKRIVKRRAFVPAKVTDNKYLGDDYVANIMMAGSAKLVKAWLEGDWDIVDGAFFDGWESGKHVIRPFEVPKDWLRFRSMDWGFATPFSIDWWAVCPDPHEVETASGRQSIIPRGALILYREWYGANDGQPNIGLRLTAEQVADGIIEREHSEKIAYGVIDPSAFAHQNGPSVAERMFAQKVQFRKADNTRVSRDKGALGGWDMMRARLRGDGETPMLYVFSTCKDFIRTVPVLQHDSDRPEDLDTEQEDHASDSARYACLSRPWVPKPIEPEKPKDLIYEVKPDGSVVANMGVRERVLMLEKKRKRDRE